MSSYSEKIAKKEKEIRYCTYVKGIFNSSKETTNTLKTELETADSRFSGTDPSGSDFGYTDSNGADSIDRGRIKKLIDRISNVKTSIGNLVSSLEGLIETKKGELEVLKALEAAELEKNKNK